MTTRKYSAGELADFLEYDVLQNYMQATASVEDYETVEQAAEMLRSMEWRPIETAPKDGTPVILYVDDICIEGYWGVVDYDEINRPLCFWTYAGNAELYENPTHWMPLPAGPEVV